MVIQPKKCQIFLLPYIIFLKFLDFFDFWNFFGYHKMIPNDTQKSSRILYL